MGASPLTSLCCCHDWWLLPTAIRWLALQLWCGRLLLRPYLPAPVHACVCCCLHVLLPPVVICAHSMAVVHLGAGAVPLNLPPPLLPTTTYPCTSSTHAPPPLFQKHTHHHLPCPALPYPQSCHYNSSRPGVVPGGPTLGSSSSSRAGDHCHLGLPGMLLVLLGSCWGRSWEGCCSTCSSSCRVVWKTCSGS